MNDGNKQPSGKEIRSNSSIYKNRISHNVKD